MKLFEDLPSTNTPITAENLNQIKDKLLVVSVTEPAGDDREKIWIQHSKNKFNKNASDIVDSTFINVQTGSTQANDNYISTGFIEIEPNKEYTMSGNYATVTNPSYCFYDASKTFISGLTLKNSDLTFTTPENAAYIRLSILKTSKDTAQLERGTKATEHAEYVESKIYVKNDNGVYEEFISENRIEDMINKSMEVKKINIVLSNDFSKGVINCFRSGKIVLVEVSDVQIKENKTEWTTILATGLPKTVGYSGGWIKGVLLHNIGNIQLSSDGELMVCERTGTQKATSIYNGQLVYMTID